MPSALETIPVERIDGQPATLADYAGKVRLVVNVASQCGLTPQYEELQRLYDNYKDRGLVVMGFPANDFKAQEPGSNEEIQRFCTSQYGVTFPMYAKISVKEGSRHPLYQAMIDEQPKATMQGTALRDRLASAGLVPDDPTAVMWNFEKFLVDRNGKVVARFAPDIKPTDPLITDAIEAALT